MKGTYKSCIFCDLWHLPSVSITFCSSHSQCCRISLLRKAPATAEVNQRKYSLQSIVFSGWRAFVYQAYKKCSVCLGPSKVMGKIFCHMCMKHTSQVHSVKSLWAGFRPGGILTLSGAICTYIWTFFCVNIYFLKFFSFEHFLRGQFYSGTCGPMVLWIL